MHNSQLFSSLYSTQADGADRADGAVVSAIKEKLTQATPRIVQLGAKPGPRKNDENYIITGKTQFNEFSHLN